MLSLFDTLAEHGAEAKASEMGIPKEIAKGLLLDSLRRRAGIRISAAVARLLIDKTGTLLRLSDEGLRAKSRIREAHLRRISLLRCERAALGGHLHCDGGLIRRPGHRGRCM